MEKGWIAVLYGIFVVFPLQLKIYNIYSIMTINTSIFFLNVAFFCVITFADEA